MRLVSVHFAVMPHIRQSCGLPYTHTQIVCWLHTQIVSVGAQNFTKIVNVKQTTYNTNLLWPLEFMASS